MTSAAHSHWPCSTCLRSRRRYRCEGPRWDGDDDKAYWYIEANSTNAEVLRTHLAQCGLTESGDCIITELRR